MADKSESLAAVFKDGITSHNPLIVSMIGLCPSLAITTSVKNAAAMSCAVIAVLLCSNIIISLLRNLIPSEIRIPCFIVVIASFVTMVDLLMQAFFPPAINRALGIFIPLIVVNCLILFRAEAFASKNSLPRAIADGLGMGLGFSLAILLVAAVRELLGSGSLWGLKVSLSYQPAAIMLLAPGAFLTLGLLLGFFNYIRLRKGAASS